MFAEYIVNFYRFFKNEAFQFMNFYMVCPNYHYKIFISVNIFFIPHL